MPRDTIESFPILSEAESSLRWSPLIDQIKSRMIRILWKHVKPWSLVHKTLVKLIIFLI